MFSSTRQVQSPNVIIEKLIIRSNSAGLANIKDINETIDTVQNNYEIDLINGAVGKTDTLSFYSLMFVEDMNEPQMTGKLILIDATNIFDHLGISTTGEIEMTLRFLDTKKSFKDVNDVRITRFFNIIDIDVMNDPASQDITRGAGTSNYISIRFSTKEFVHSDFITLDYSIEQNPSSPFREFIGPISDVYDPEYELTPLTVPLDPKLKITKLVIPDTSPDAPADATIPVLDDFNDELYTIENRWHIDQPTFFGNLIVLYNDERTLKDRPKKNFYSHKTHNDVWIKPEYFHFPAYRPAETPRITQLIHYIKQFACRWENPNYVDFMFWEDLSGFHFKSISKLVEDAPDEENTPTFWPDVNTQTMNTIVSMDVIKDTDPMELIANGALTSEYLRIKPNWRNPFRNVVSGFDRFRKELVKYSYKEDIWEYENYKEKNDTIITNKRYKEEENKGYSPFSSKDMNITSNKYNFNSGAFRMGEEIYGFYDKTTYNSAKSPWWEFIHPETIGFKWDPSKYKQSINLDPVGLTYDFKNPQRLEEEYWQSQYDICELPGAGLYLIQKNIKRALAEQRIKYAEAKQHNEKWKFYLENICCERKMPLNFFALLTKAEKIYGGDGITFQKDPGGIYAYNWVEVEFWPRESAEAILQNGEEIIKFDGYESYPFVFVKPKGALQGHGSMTKMYTPKTQWADTVWKGDPQPEKYKEYQTKDTRAFNINEILNTVGITLTKADLETVDPKIKTAIDECKAIITNPGVSIPFDRTKENCKTSYPEGYSMMPIGNFRYIGDCSTTQKDWNFGRIVQMHSIPREIMQTMVKGEQGITGMTLDDMGNKGDRAAYTQTIPGTETPITMGKIKEKKNIPYLFVFDVVNAHDGLCDTTCVI